MTVGRYELGDGRLIGVDSAVGDEWLEADEPFPYRIQPSAL